LVRFLTDTTRRCLRTWYLWYRHDENERMGEGVGMATANLLYGAVDLEEMGRRIDRAREDAGLTVSQLSFRSEVNESLLRKYLKGENEPGAAKLGRIARALDVNADWLLQNTDNPAPVPDVWVPGKTADRRASSPGGGGPPEVSIDPPKPNRRSRRRIA
jgi:hypothetical protein